MGNEPYMEFADDHNKNPALIINDVFADGIS